MTKVNDIIKELNDCVNELDKIIENARSTENTSGLDSFENFEVKAKNIMSVDAEDEYHAVRLTKEMYTLKEKFFDVIRCAAVWGVRYCPLCRYHDRHIADTGTCEECILNPGHVGCHPAYKDFAESFTREKFDELKAAIDALPSEPPSCTGRPEDQTKVFGKECMIIPVKECDDLKTQAKERVDLKVRLAEMSLQIEVLKRDKKRQLEEFDYERELLIVTLSRYAKHARKLED